MEPLAGEVNTSGTTCSHNVCGAHECAPSWLGERREREATVPGTTCNSTGSVSEAAGRSSGSGSTGYMDRRRESQTRRRTSNSSSSTAGEQVHAQQFGLSADGCSHAGGAARLQASPGS